MGRGAVAEVELVSVDAEEGSTIDRQGRHHGESRQGAPAVRDTAISRRCRIRRCAIYRATRGSYTGLRHSDTRETNCRRYH